MQTPSPTPPPYAILPKQNKDATHSQHGAPIDLGDTYAALTGKPLTINGVETLAINPDRYKQHGFHFNADNCIACHACESACSEKNNLPSHLAFRKVGFIEGGSYPDVVRLNISMACNHCDNPVCLKGCPTLAYTKYVEYGAVLQDPDICFGCGYCTWVCPYNAPQLDPVKGEVQKCNMCIDRLELGLKPACVAACLSNALDFGVIEDIPQASQQAKLAIPGFPDPSITRPNIRFQQTRSLPSSFSRGDGQPVRYYKDQAGQETFKTGAHEKKEAKDWGDLSSREDPLVLFTLLSQGVAGAFLIFYLLLNWGGHLSETIATHPIATAMMLFGLTGLQTIGLVTSTLHLGKPRYFYRAMNNLRHSWVSREIFTMGTFYHLLGGYTIVSTFPSLISWLPGEIAALVPPLLGWGAVLMGPVGLFCMAQCYRIKARPFWDHWHSEGAFYSSALILGSLVVGLTFGIAEVAVSRTSVPLLKTCSFVLTAGLLLQGISLFAHFRYLDQRGDEAAASKQLMLTTYGKTYTARWISFGVLLATSVAFALIPSDGMGGGASLIAVVVWGLMTLLSIFHEKIGRALFYVVVIPTTHPGAFFWGNKVFETHARQSRLAEMPVGVHPDAH